MRTDGPLATESEESQSEISMTENDDDGMEQIDIPEIGIEIVDTTYFKGGKERKYQA